MKRTATIAAAAGLMLTFGVTGTAQAGIDCTNIGQCSIWTGSFPGGTISIDVDAINRGGGLSSENLRWQLNGVIGCYARFDVKEPARSWVCNAPAGNYQLVAWSPPGNRYDWDLGVRW